MLYEGTLSRRWELIISRRIDFPMMGGLAFKREMGSVRSEGKDFTSRL
jgi:hypothetical protein